MNSIIKKYSLLLLTAVMAISMMAAAAFSTRTVSAADVNRFAMEEGAYIRLLSPKGLRFVAEMGSTTYTNLTKTEAGVSKQMGMYIVPSEYLNDPAKYSNGATGVSGKQYQNITTKIDLVFYKSDGSVENKIYSQGDYYRANGVISNLKLANYDREFIGIGYIARTVSSTTTYTFADFDKTVNERSALYVAQKLYANYSDVNVLSILDDYIYGAHLESLGMTESVTTVGGVRTVTYSYKGTSYDSIAAAKTAANCNFSMSLESSKLYINGLDKTVSAGATITDSGNGGAAVSVDIPVNWTTSNSSVVTVDRKGVAHAVGGGTATITASYNGVSSSRTVEVFDGTFETISSVPSYITKSNDAGTLAIVTKDGDKCLNIPTTGDNPRLVLQREFLAGYFADENVQYVAFDARTDSASIQAFRYHSGSSYPYFEFNNANFGLKSEWKSFYFPRAAYQAMIDNSRTEDQFIYATGCSSGENIYLDNFRHLTSAEYLEELYGFDSGRLYLSGSNLLYYPINSPKETTWQLAINCDKTPTAYGTTYTTVSHGIRAVTFTKAAGTYKVRLNSSTALSDLTSTGYYAFDLYVPAGADTTLTGTIKYSTLSDSAYYHVGNPKAGAWTTVYVNNNYNYPVSITDTTGGTYYIDHFRSISTAEFDAADSRWVIDKISDNNRIHFYESADFRTETSSYNNFSFRVVQGSSGILTSAQLDGNMTHGSTYSYSFTKNTGYIALSLGTSSVYADAVTNGFTFWIYSTVGLNGKTATNFINGNNAKFNGGAGLSVSANTWTQVTIAASDISSGRFLIIQGSTAGTIYIDGIEPLP